MRQIVIKDGELALTRMTPVSEDTSNVVRWASEVHQEFKATMSYLTRFGFQQEDGLHIITIANAPCSEALQEMIEEPCKFSGLTSVEAARHYEKMLALAPESVEARNELGVAYAQLGRFDDARAQFEAVLRIKPDHQGAQENLARLRGANLR